MTTLIRTCALSIISMFMAVFSQAQELEWPAKTTYRYEEVLGKRIFYREAGDPAQPTILLLHGFPSSSHTYRELIPLLSGKYHVIAPDYLGSGFSDRPDPDQHRYTFDLLADHVIALMKKLGDRPYVLYMQDFGAPVGFRVMLKRPEKLTALIVQNGNAYLDGLTPARQEFFRLASEDKSPENIRRLFNFVGESAIINNQYLRDVKGRPEIMSPDAWTHDLARLATDKDRKIQVQLFQDYYSNILAYPTWQEFLRTTQPRTLIAWGQNDPAFIAAGAKAYLRDLPNAELHLLDAGHFALEEQPVQIAKLMRSFLARILAPRDAKNEPAH